ncbi:putative RNA-directed DNA polymerase from transposon BS [Takifugu flavidus]|uniref:Putative RNA-directed DNA polymerase from transposon BS n=1 Tax=Takifugu flavidus TaxID=433684 RepID=A0A5C6N114_9TELE|nr:putative RNA-directed DNA polymerase from transposon BS [Takifugu flavidus]
MALRDCFDTTDWDVLCEPHGEDIDGLTTCITDYINFCVENIVPTRKVRCFLNNKPWVTPDLKALLNEKKRVFRSGDKEELRRVQKELRRRIRRGKDSYRRKLEERLKGSNAREVWRGLKTIWGHTKDSGRGPESGGLDWANELNSFFNRFDCAAPASPTHQSPDLTVLSHHHPPSPPVTPPAPAALSSHHATSLHPLPDRPSQSNPRPHPPGVTPRLSITADQVRKELRRTKTRKATGPDGINSRLLKDCADQLCGVLLHIFNLSLSLERVPLLWKTSCVVPVPKTAHAREPNHFRPVALTSHRMKTMERIVLTHLRQLVDSKTDPLQFAYRPGIGVDDAVIYLLHRSLPHLESTGSTVRVMFFDFSNAFNTIQPSLLRGKMEGAGVDCHLAAWTTDYLANRLQYVRLRDCESDVVVCSTGAPQGTVLSPFLFTLYTSDFSHNSDSCHLQKFSDHTAIIGRVSEGNELEYREVITNVVAWCELNHLRINTSKTKEVVIDFSRKASHIAPVNIQGLDIEIVEEYKCLGVHLNNKLDWTHNTDALYKKGQSRLHLLRRLRSFGDFYDSVVASVIFYAVVCWSCGSSERDRKRLNKLVRRAGSVLDCSLDSIEEVGERRMLAKLTSIMNTPSHPLHETVGALSSSFSSRLLHPRCKRERYRRSFIPTAVRLFNMHNP